MLKLLPKHPHVQCALPKLIKVILDGLRVEKDGVHRPKIELSQILVREVGVCKNDGCEILRRVINLVSTVKEIESELMAGQHPLLVSDHRNGRSYNERCGGGKIGWLHRVLNFLQNVKALMRARKEGE